MVKKQPTTLEGKTVAALIESGKLDADLRQIRNLCNARLKVRKETSVEFMDGSNLTSEQGRSRTTRGRL